MPVAPILTTTRPVLDSSTEKHKFFRDNMQEMAKEYRYRTVFSHHFSGSFDFNTVNIHHTVGTDFLIQFPQDGFGQRMAAHFLESGRDV